MLAFIPLAVIVLSLDLSKSGHSVGKQADFFTPAYIGESFFNVPQVLICDHSWRGDHQIDQFGEKS